MRVLVIPEDFLNDPETGCSKERTENGKMRKSQPRGGVGMKHLQLRWFRYSRFPVQDSRMTTPIP